MAMTTDMGLCPHQRNEQQWMICDSILQELTTAAFELFRPENSIDDFLERMAMRLGNVVIVAVSLSGEKARLLASAGLSSGSRKLPLSAIELVQDRFPWPEVHRSDISSWTFDVTSIGLPRDLGDVRLVLFRSRLLKVSPMYRGLVERVTRIVCRAVQHRRVLAKLQESGRKYSEQTDLLECIVNSSPVGVMYVPNEGEVMCNRRVQELFGLGPRGETLETALSKMTARIETPADLSARMAEYSLLLESRMCRGTLPRGAAFGEEGIDLTLHDGRRLTCFCIPVRNRQRSRVGACWYFRERLERNHVELEHQAALEKERAARAASEKMQKRMHLLSEVGRVLISSLDHRQQIKGVADICIPEIADILSIDLFGAYGFDRFAFSAVRSPEKPDAPLFWMDISDFQLDMAAPVGPGHVMSAGVTELWPRLDEKTIDRFGLGEREKRALLALKPTSAIYVPLIARNRCLGVFTLASQGTRVYGEEDRLLAEDLAMRLSFAMDNVWLLRQAEKAAAASGAEKAVDAHDSGLQAQDAAFQMAGVSGGPLGDAIGIHPLGQPCGEGND